ncbi:MAG TPA: cellulase family glycosylhydrolase [Puia sp.]
MKFFLLGICLLAIATLPSCDLGAPAPALPYTAPPSTVVTTNRPLFKDFMGINGHVTFKPELYGQVCRLVRNYHNIDWDVKKVGDPLTIPVTSNNINWKTDIYGPWKQKGFETDICLQFGTFGTGDHDLENTWKGKEQWTHDYGKQMASFFGPSGVEKLATSFEIDNEPGRQIDAALFKTIFKQMAGGIRAGDPKALILTPAVQARPTDDYYQGLNSIYADKDILPLYDVINIHTYATLPQSGTSKNLWNRSFPEDPSLPDYFRIVDEAIAWRNQHAPGKKVWVTEFGYDACTPEAMQRRKDWALKLNWQGATDLQQAQYIVRSFLLFVTRDIDRAYLYFYNDDDEPAVHGSSGLTRRFQPKMSFWAVRQLYETLGNYRFHRIVKNEDGKLFVYEFEQGDDTHKKIWVAWSPTGTPTQEKEGYQPRTIKVTLDNMPGKPLLVTGMATADGPAPAAKWEPAGDKAITLTIGESPTFIVMNK